MTSFSDILVNDKPMTATDWLVDIVVAAGAFGLGCLQLTLAVNLLVPDDMLRHLLGIETMVPTASSVAAIALTTVMLVIRRRYPWPVFVTCLLTWMMFQSYMTSVSLTLVGPLVALFTLAYERPRTEALAAGGLAAVALLAVPVTSSAVLASLSLVQNLAFLAAAGFAGYALRVRQDYLHAAEERAEQAERTRESEAQRRVEEERVRIAREVHDITAHSLSAVSIQAAAAERLVDSNPQAAKESIAAVRATAKEALEDMRAMIGVLRAGGENVQTRPTEGTERIADLAAYLKGAGVACTLDVSDYRRAVVPVHVDVALFGIAREACTNIVRHAGASRATLSLRTTSDAAELSVEDDGCGFNYRAEEGAVEGHGLAGMRERVRVLNGCFSAGSASCVGYGAQDMRDVQDAQGAQVKQGAQGDRRGFRIEVSVPLHADDGEGGAR